MEAYESRNHAEAKFFAEDGEPSSRVVNHLQAIEISVVLFGR